MTPNRIARPKLAADFLTELATHRPNQETPAGTTGEPLLVQSLVQDAARARASDIHIEPGSNGTVIRFRIDGVISDVAIVAASQGRMIINQFKAMAELDPVASFIPRDAHASCRIDSGRLNLRLALTPSEAGEALVIRVLDVRRLHHAMSDLGLADSDLRLLQDWIEQSAGMFLTVGPTGSGKTTTVYSLLHELKLAEHSIVSLEDPVEYQIDGVVQVELDERHHLNFAGGIKQMLRLDPDYLMLGEIRDAVSARAAVDAAISGRVLLSTLHCRDAAGVLTALRNWGLEDHEIAEAVSVVVSQRLVRRLCPHCRQKRPLTQKEKDWFAAVGLPAPAEAGTAEGCAKCGNIGYLGRVGIFELWRLDDEDYAAILHHTSEQAIRHSMIERGHESILSDGLAKVNAGLTSVAELRRAASAAPPSVGGWSQSRILTTA